MANCGGHSASTCRDCGSSQNMCNGECGWSFEQQSCQLADGQDLVTLHVVLGYDQYFSNRYGGQEKATIEEIVRGANKRFGESNLSPGVRLVVKEIYSVNVEVPLHPSGGLRNIPKSLEMESARKGAPFVLITGKGRMSGVAKQVGYFCHIQQGTWAVSSCDTSRFFNLVIFLNQSAKCQSYLLKDFCANPLVHEIGHLIGMGHDVDVGCPDQSGHMSSNHHKWSSCSNRFVISGVYS